jgi:hypothetical protein
MANSNIAGDGAAAYAQAIDARAAIEHGLTRVLTPAARTPPLSGLAAALPPGPARDCAAATAHAATALMTSIAATRHAITAVAPGRPAGNPR